MANSALEDKALTLLMLHQALEGINDIWTQSPHWQSEPTAEMRCQEEAMVEQAQDAEREVRRLAGEIYLALTGIQPIGA